MSQGKHNARDYSSPYSLHPAAIPTTLNYRLRQEGRSHMTPSIVGFDDLVNLLPRYDCYQLERWDCLPLRNRAFARRTLVLT